MAMNLTLCTVGLRCLWNVTHGDLRQLNLPEEDLCKIPRRTNTVSEFSVSAIFIPVMDSLIPDSAILFHWQMFLQ